MILPAGLLLPVCLLAVQAPGAPAEAPHAPVRAICLSLKGNEPPAPGMDLRRIESDLAALLSANGIAVLPLLSGPSTSGAYRLDLSLEVQDLSEGSGSCP